MTEKKDNAVKTYDPAADTEVDAGERQVVDTGKARAKLPAKEIGGRDGPEPTRFGDWEKNGRCIDF